MKWYIVIFAVVAVGFAEDCSEERVSACLSDLLSTLLLESSEEEVCKELKSANKCLASAADECLGQDREAEVDEGLKQLEDLLSEHCPHVVDDDESEPIGQSCLEENKDYVMACMVVGARETMDLLGSQPDVDPNVVKCTAYSLISECVLDRAEEKCGFKVKVALEEELDDAPEEIVEACNAADNLDFTEVRSLLTKK